MSGSDCHHTHAEDHSTQRKLRVLLLLLLAYMGVEVMGGWVSGSLALIADAGHMAIDAASVAIGLFATWIASRPPTPRKTYGYYRAEILAALVNGAALIVVALWIFYEAWQRFGNPSEIQGNLMFWVALGGLAVNLIGMLLLHGNRGSLNARAVWLHLMADTLGSISAVIASLLIRWFNWYRADAFVSVGLGLLILWGAWGLLAECVNVLLEAVPRGINASEIKSQMESQTAVQEVHDLHIWTLASGVPSLSAHVRVKESSDVSHVLEALTKMLKEKFGIAHVTLQVEPAAFEHDEMDV